MKHLTAIAVAGFVAATVLPAAAVEISGAGATFPYPIYAKWADTYKKETGVGLNYQSIGSGGGIKQIEAKTVTFGATDMPLQAAEISKKSAMVQFPDGDGRYRAGREHRRDQVRRTESRRAIRSPKIFLGKVKNWDDPAIKKLNPNAKLPARRSSLFTGPTVPAPPLISTYYLSKVSPDWKSDVGSNTSVEWPVGIGAKGNEGVSNNVARPRARSATWSTPTRCRTS